MTHHLQDMIACFQHFCISVKWNSDFINIFILILYCYESFKICKVFTVMINKSLNIIV